MTTKPIQFAFLLPMLFSSCSTPQQTYTKWAITATEKGPVVSIIEKTSSEVTLFQIPVSPETIYSRYAKYKDDKDCPYTGFQVQKGNFLVSVAPHTDCNYIINYESIIESSRKIMPSISHP